MPQATDVSSGQSGIVRARNPQLDCFGGVDCVGDRGSQQGPCSGTADGWLAMNAASEVRVRIAGITIAATCLSEDWAWTDGDRFAAFVSDDEPDVVVRVHVGPPAEGAPVGDPVRSLEGLRNIYLDEKNWTFEFRPHMREEYPQRPPHQILVFDRGFCTGDLYLSIEKGYEKPTFSFGVFLSELLGGMLPLRGGLMLHACGVSDDGRGIVFVGPSGAGKSTMAGLWKGHAGVRVLNDDRIILRRNGRRWWAYPVPGVGEPCRGSPEGVELEAVFLLSQAVENAAERMNQAGAASSLLPHISLPSYDAVAVDSVLQLLDELVNEVPIYELGFLPDQTAVRVVRDVVRQRDVLE